MFLAKKKQQKKLYISTIEGALRRFKMYWIVLIYIGLTVTCIIIKNFMVISIYIKLFSENWHLVCAVDRSE